MMESGNGVPFNGSNSNLGMNFGLAAAMAVAAQRHNDYPHHQPPPQLNSQGTSSAVAGDQAMANGYMGVNQQPPPPPPPQYYHPPGPPQVFPPPPDINPQNKPPPPPQPFPNQYHQPPQPEFMDYSRDNSDAFTSLQSKNRESAFGGGSGNSARPPFAPPFNTATSNAGYNAPPVSYNPGGAIGPQFPPPANANNVGNNNPRPNNPPLPRPPFQTQHARVPHGGERSFQPPPRAPVAVGPTAGQQSFGHNARPPSHFGNMTNSQAQSGASSGSSNTTTGGLSFDGYSFDQFVVEADPNSQRSPRGRRPPDYNSPTPFRVLKCKLCNVYSNNAYQMNLHVKGKPHNERLVKYNERPPPKKHRQNYQQNQYNDNNNRRQGGGYNKNYNDEREEPKTMLDQPEFDRYKIPVIQDDSENANKVPIGTAGRGHKLFGGRGRGGGWGHNRYNNSRMSAPQNFSADVTPQDMERNEKRKAKETAELQHLARIQDKENALIKRNENFGKPPEPIKLQPYAPNSESIFDSSWQPRPGPPIPSAPPFRATVGMGAAAAVPPRPARPPFRGTAPPPFRQQPPPFRGPRPSLPPFRGVAPPPFGPRHPEPLYEEELYEYEELVEEPVEYEYVYEYEDGTEVVAPSLPPVKRHLLPGEAPFDPPVPVAMELYPEEPEEEVLVEYPPELAPQPVLVSPLEPVYDADPIEVPAAVPPMAGSRVIVRRGAQAPPFGRPARGPPVREGFAAPPLRPMH